MINERVLPNPFKAEGSTHLDHVMAAIERELDDYDAPLPAFLDAGFLARLELEVHKARPEHHAPGRRLVTKLRSRLLARMAK
jgi:hypothetical protein